MYELGIFNYLRRKKEMTIRQYYVDCNHLRNSSKIRPVDRYEKRIVHVQPRKSLF